MINVKTAPWDAEEGELIQPAGRNLAPKLSGCGQRPPGLGAQGSQEALTNQGTSESANGGETLAEAALGAACTWRWLQVWGHSGDLRSHLHPTIPELKSTSLPLPQIGSKRHSQ